SAPHANKRRQIRSIRTRRQEPGLVVNVGAWMTTGERDRRGEHGDDFMLYDLNDTVTGDRLAPPVKHCLGDPRTRYVNIHTGRPGCFLCRAERLVSLLAFTLGR